MAQHFFRDLARCHANKATVMYSQTNYRNCRSKVPPAEDFSFNQSWRKDSYLCTASLMPRIRSVWQQSNSIHCMLEPDPAYLSFHQHFILHFLSYKYLQIMLMILMPAVPFNSSILLWRQYSTVPVNLEHVTCQSYGFLPLTLSYTRHSTVQYSNNKHHPIIISITTIAKQSKFILYTFFSYYLRGLRGCVCMHVCGGEVRKQIIRTLPFIKSVKIKISLSYCHAAALCHTIINLISFQSHEGTKDRKK